MYRKMNACSKPYHAYALLYNLCASRTLACGSPPPRPRRQSRTRGAFHADHVTSTVHTLGRAGGDD
eukprot:scaffold112483_cov54-Phaeocystis_antarctica.AAC.1